jgi:hypothetical protein
MLRRCKVKKRVKKKVKKRVKKKVISYWERESRKGRRNPYYG